MAPTVDEISGLCANFMVNPIVRPGPTLCPTCLGFRRPGFPHCFGCDNNPTLLDAIVPITYSPHGEQMHHALREYKDGPTADVRWRFMRDITAVLWRFLRDHEPCLASASDAPGFSLVTQVPSASVARNDRPGGMRKILGEWCDHTTDRYRDVIQPTGHGASERRFDPDRYKLAESVAGENVLLVDDTWASGSKAQSAAHALKEGGAATVTGLVVGRHVRREFEDTDAILKAQPAFDWSRCAVH